MRDTYILQKYKVEHPICEKCGSTEDIQVHHIIPLSLDGTNDTSNLISLCYKCHKEEHKENHSELTKMGIQKAKEAPIKDILISKLALLQKIQDEELTSAKEIVDYIIEAPVKKYIT